jgi:hypothetical protein
MSHRAPRRRSIRATTVLTRAVLPAGLVLLGAATSLVQAREPLPQLVIPEGFGVNIHFTGEPGDLDRIHAGGFRFVRMDLSWSGVERQKGVYDFERAGYDALTAGCSKRGIRILYILDYSNRLYEEQHSIRTEAGRKAYAAFAEAAGKRYAGKGILWEFWNEPNIQQFWSPQPGIEEYCKMVEEAAARLRQADPSGTLVAPATSTIPFDWLESCFQKGLLNWIDVLSVHPYRPQAPETVIKDYARLRKLIERYAPAGKEIPVISGEWGYSHINWDKARLSDEQQANYLARMFLINLYEKVPVSIWYDWKNDGTDPNEREHHFGTVGHDLQPKAAYRAAQSLSSSLAGYAIEQRLEPAEERDFVFQLTRGDRRALAAWTTGESHEIVLPVRASQGTLIDMQGGQKRISWPPNQLRLTLSAGPQYVLVSD